MGNLRSRSVPRSPLGRSSQFRTGSVTPAEHGSMSELHFVRALSQNQMRKAYRESIKANQPADKEELKTSIENFLESVQAAAKGSKMRLTCLPGKGLEIQQGKKKSLISGNREFLDLILKLYIGNKPPTPAVARGLLGQHPKTVADKAAGTAEAEEKLRKVPTPDAPPR